LTSRLYLLFSSLVCETPSRDRPVSPLTSSPFPVSNVSFYECDITQKSRLHEVATKIQNEVGAPSILINNAGIGRSYDILEASEEHLNQIFAINTISHWFTVQEFLPDMIKNKKGHIVTIASMASFTSVAGMAEYCATKASALAFHEGKFSAYHVIFVDALES